MNVTFGQFVKAGMGLAIGWGLGSAVADVIGYLASKKGRSYMKDEYRKRVSEEAERNLCVVRQHNNKSETPTTGA